VALAFQTAMTHAPLEPGERVGKYVIKCELGRGGMGAVYLAEHALLGREVAIKELIPKDGTGAVEVQRFMQEARALARARHPNIIQVHDLEQVGDARYLVLEYVRGRSLRQWLNTSTVPLPQVFAVMRGVLDALDYAHRRAIVHRDVKPENVLVSDEGGVKVTDFGVARLTDEAVTPAATRAGTTEGTPQNMSPEQVSTSKVDGRSDIYSAGILLYELVCGRPPFASIPGEGPFTLLTKHVQTPPPPPALHRPGLDSGLERVMLKSLAKRAEERYQTGAEFAQDLAKVADRLAPGWEHSLRPA
jgi:serine/threonine-protein kinase